MPTERAIDNINSLVIDSMPYYITQKLHALEVTVLVKEHKLLRVGNNIEPTLKVCNHITKPHVGTLVLAQHLKSLLQSLVVLVGNPRFENRKALLVIRIITLVPIERLSHNWRFINIAHSLYILAQLPCADTIQPLLPAQFVVQIVKQLVECITVITIAETTVEYAITQKSILVLWHI